MRSRIWRKWGLGCGAWAPYVPGNYGGAISQVFALRGDPPQDVMDLRFRLRSRLEEELIPQAKADGVFNEIDLNLEDCNHRFMPNEMKSTVSNPELIETEEVMYVLSREVLALPRLGPPDALALLNRPNNHEDGGGLYGWAISLPFRVSGVGGA